MKKELLNIHTDKIKKEYEIHLEKYDPNSPEIVHWRGKEKVWLRFDILTDIDKLDGKKILDFGCGNALLADYLKERNTKCEYYGWDISEEMIKIAKRRHPDGKFRVVNVLEDDIKKYHNYFDYVIISGVFNGIFYKDVEGCGIYDLHKEWICKILIKLWKLCKKGIAVNFLTQYVDWEEEDLYYCKISEIVDFCVSNLSRWFVVRHDYQLYEFTMYIYKEPRVKL